MMNVELLLEEYAALKTERFTWDDHYQELAEFLLPSRADFTSEREQGGKRTEKQFDGTPMLARRQLASALDGLLKPKNQEWAFIEPEDEDLAEDQDVKEWLEEVQEKLHSAIYHPKAKFIESSGEVDNDLVTFGTGALFIGERADKQGLLFKAFHLKNVFVDVNSEGEIDRVFLREMLNRRQVRGRFGDKTPKHIEDEQDKTKRFEFVQVVAPQHDFDSRRKGVEGMPYKGIVIDCKEAEIVFEEGFYEFPFAVPRWDTMSGEKYGRSPGMLALPDTKTLNQQGKTLLSAGQRAVAPPWLVPSEGIVGMLRNYPNGISYYDAGALKLAGQSSPVFQMESRANIPWGLELQRDYRDMVWSAFFKNVLNLPIDGPQMTATEVIERKEEFMRIIGPTFGRLESGYIAPLYERAFMIELRAGRFGVPPEALRGRNVKFRFASPIERAKKQIEVMNATRATEVLAPYIQQDPSILDNFDLDEIGRDTAEGLGWPAEWLRPIQERDALREQRAQAMAQQAQKEDLLQGADAAAKLGVSVQ